MKRPIIAITPSLQRVGEEFSDRSISLSLCYTQAIEAAGGIPLTVPLTTERDTVREVLAIADGILLTGGGDVDTRFYQKRVPAKLKKKLGGVDPSRDELELELVRQAHRCKIPVLGICRGLQVINVAFGGTLIVDIPSQVKGSLRHGRSDRKNDAVHEVRIEPGTRLAEILGRKRLGVNSSHHQAVASLGNVLRISAHSSDGVVEGIETVNGPFLVGVQFHPERMWRAHRILIRLFQSFIQSASHAH